MLSQGICGAMLKKKITTTASAATKAINGQIIATTNAVIIDGSHPSPTPTKNPYVEMQYI
jgi:hypothetical protein